MAKNSPEAAGRTGRKAAGRKQHAQRRRAERAPRRRAQRRAGICAATDANVDILDAADGVPEGTKPPRLRKFIFSINKYNFFKQINRRDGFVPSGPRADEAGSRAGPAGRGWAGRTRSAGSRRRRGQKRRLRTGTAKSRPEAGRRLRGGVRKGVCPQVSGTPTDQGPAGPWSLINSN